MIDLNLPLNSDSKRPADQPESYARILGRPLAVLGVVVALAAYQAWPRPQPKPRVETPLAVVARATPAEPAPAAAEVVDEIPAPVTPAPKPAPTLDRAAVARAEVALDQASRERAHADDRLAEAEKALAAATIQSAQDMANGKAIASVVRDPSARIAAASTKGGFLKGERDRLKKELAAIERVPQSKTHALMAKSAVAKPTEGTEYHFEVRRNRVTFVDLDRLVEMVKSDVKLRLRAGGARSRLGASVGPVGSFSLRYEMGRSIPDALASVLNSSEVTYNLLGWELVPEGPNRGETLDGTRSSSSNYARAIHRLNPDRDTITMWIYPDGFALYRQLRDDLHAHGFLVAARPLPDGTSIKGSPTGSLSAGQ